MKEVFMTSFFFLLLFTSNTFYYKRENDPNNQLIVFGDFQVGKLRFRGIYIPSFFIAMCFSMNSPSIQQTTIYNLLVQLQYLIRIQT